MPGHKAPHTPQAPQEAMKAGPPSTAPSVVQKLDDGAPEGAVAAHQAMQGGFVVPASGGGCPVPMHGTSTVQLHGLPMHDVVLASCGMHTFGLTAEGVVVKSFGQPRVAPDELPEPPPLDEPEPELPEPPELLELPGPGEGDVCPPHATTTASTDAPTIVVLMSTSLRRHGSVRSGRRSNLALQLGCGSYQVGSSPAPLFAAGVVARHAPR